MQLKNLHATFKYIVITDDLYIFSWPYELVSLKKLFVVESCRTLPKNLTTTTSKF
jgi:hypothetical protein